MAKRRKFSVTDKESVAQRAFGVCEYGQMPEDFSTDTFEMEHITALTSIQRFVIPLGNPRYAKDS